MIRRREFIALLGGAAAWPWSASAQQPATTPLVGMLHVSGSAYAPYLAAFRKGLSEMGYVEGRNIAIEVQSAQDDYSRLSDLAADLVRRQVAVLVAAGGMETALAAKAATTTVPIVFRTGLDPVQAGLVASFNRPGGNITGLTDMTFDLLAKQFGLLHEIKRGAAPLAVLIDPNAAGYDTVTGALRTAASALSRDIEFFNAGNNREIDLAFEKLVQKKCDGLLVSPDALFGSRRIQVVALAAHHRVPTIYFQRDFVESGGLMSYGRNLGDQYRQLGIYAGRILKGEKPADLPVLRPTKFEFVLNLHTAKLLGLDIPPGLLATADEVIE
jgi:putative ABC transport system substrate-binding protein